MNNLQSRTNIHHSSIARRRRGNNYILYSNKNLHNMYKNISRTFVSSMSSVSYITLIFLLVLFSTPYTISSRSSESHHPDQSFNNNRVNKHLNHQNHISKHKHHSTSHNNQGKIISNYLFGSKNSRNVYFISIWNFFNIFIIVYFVYYT